MIHFSGIAKQHGPQILFRDASFQILQGSRTGLVGPKRRGQNKHLPPDHGRGRI